MLIAIQNEKGKDKMTRDVCLKMQKGLKWQFLKRCTIGQTFALKFSVEGIRSYSFSAPIGAVTFEKL